MEYTYTPNANENKKFNNAVIASKRGLNRMHNTIKAFYNRGNRSNTLKRMAARYTAAKNSHKKFLTGKYTRSNKHFKKPTRFNAYTYFIENPNAYRNAQRTYNEMNVLNTNNQYERYATNAAANVLRSGRNVFEDFNFSNMPALENVPVVEPSINRSAFKAMKLSAENINNLRKGLNNGPTAGNN